MVIALMIEKDIPLPKKKRFGYFDAPYDRMEIGDSFFYELREGQKRSSVHASLIGNGRRWALRNGLYHRFVTRNEGNGIRVWRVADNVPIEKKITFR